jgi:predicted ATPase/DNA-binding CsgD family transcriptional regulator
MAHIQTRSDRLTDPLTDREQEILACLAERLTNQEIATWLHLAEKTVRWYNSQIYSKLGVSSRAEAVAKANALGLLTVPDSGLVARKHNLLTQATRFIGRQQELDELAALLADHHTRLVTILAPGGMGKTRLALESARRHIGRYSDGVFFIPLAPLASPDDIVTAIAESIGFVFYGENTPTQQLINFLRDRAMLLVLDNFEHLLVGAPLVADLVQAAPGVRVLATSRERLNLHAEIVYTLAGLDFPTWETPDDALGYDAVILFVQSAFRIRPDFVLQAEGLDLLARICRLTGGMPLGIELAAGWVDVLSLEQIANEIQRGIDILETDMRDVPERHRSLRATFEQTWHRLTSDEQIVFATLSVFRGGFTLESAEAVASANLRHLRKLAQKSLIQIETNERYAIHELLRQFGEGKLAELAELPTIQEKHAQHFADFMAERKHDSKSDKQLEAFHLFGAEFENVRVAWQYFVKTGAWEQLPKFLDSLFIYADLGTHAQELVDLLEPAVATLRALPSTAQNELVLGQILAVLSWGMTDIGFPKRGVVIGDEAIQISRQHGSLEDLVVALFHQVEALMFADQYDLALLRLEEGIPLAQTLGDVYLEAHLLRQSTSVQIYYKQNYGQAIRHAEQAQQLFDRLNMHYDLGLLFLLMGQAYVFQEQYEQAQSCFERSLQIARQFNKSPIASPDYFFLGRIAIVQGDLVLARRYLADALLILWNTGYYWLLHWPLPYITLLYVKQQAIHRAVEVLACIDPNLIFWRNNDPLIRNLREELESQLDPQSFAAAWKRGQEREFKAFVRELLAELAGE